MVPEKKVKLILAEDGSGKGAAFLAAIATRMRRDELMKGEAGGKL